MTDDIDTGDWIVFSDGRQRNTAKPGKWTAAKVLAAEDGKPVIRVSQTGQLTTTTTRCLKVTRVNRACVVAVFLSRGEALQLLNLLVANEAWFTAQQQNLPVEFARRRDVILGLNNGETE